MILLLYDIIIISYHQNLFAVNFVLLKSIVSLNIIVMQHKISVLPCHLSAIVFAWRHSKMIIIRKNKWNINHLISSVNKCKDIDNMKILYITYFLDNYFKTIWCYNLCSLSKNKLKKWPTGIENTYPSYVDTY